MWDEDCGEVRVGVVWSERRAGRGEDAEPLGIFHRVSGSGLLAVFDGAGGAGAAPAWPGPPGGEPYSGAWVGARVARLGAERWFREAVLRDRPPTAAALDAYLRRALAAARPGRRSKLTGSMRRALPTTMAALTYRIDGSGLRAQALWAGDSRAYLLLPGSGLHAVTRDDTVEEDALEQLRQDPPMTNLLSADREFTLSAHPAAGQGMLPLPCVLLAATDGFFGYVHTPGQFEWVLLETLLRARDMGDWMRRLGATVRGYTADDASLAVAVAGFADFPHLRKAFRERRAHVGRLCTENLPAAAGRPDRAGQEALRMWQDASWAAYRPAYECYMPPPRDEPPDRAPGSPDSPGAVRT